MPHVIIGLTLHRIIEWGSSNMRVPAATTISRRFVIQLYVRVVDIIGVETQAMKLQYLRVKEYKHQVSYMTL